MDKHNQNLEIFCYLWQWNQSQVHFVHYLYSIRIRLNIAPLIHICLNSENTLLSKVLVMTQWFVPKTQKVLKKNIMHLKLMAGLIFPRILNTQLIARCNIKLLERWQMSIGAIMIYIQIQDSKSVNPKAYSALYPNR